MDTEKPLILVVDDESDSLAYLFDLLHNEGYRVMPTSSPLDALDMVTKRKPRLIISDLRMPDLDGMELLDRVKEMSPRSRVILLTAYGDRTMRQDVIRRGGHRTYRIIVAREFDALAKAAFEQYWSPLERLGCSYEGTGAPLNLFAVDVPPEVEVEQVESLLEDGHVDSTWDYERACPRP